MFFIFYRPAGLSIAPDKAIELLQFSMAEPDAERRVQLDVYNASPYHVTFSTLAVHPPGAPEEAEPLPRFSSENPAERMVAPFAELRLPMEWGALPEGVRCLRRLRSNTPSSMTPAVASRGGRRWDNGADEYEPLSAVPSPSGRRSPKGG